MIWLLDLSALLFSQISFENITTNTRNGCIFDVIVKSGHCSMFENITFTNCHFDEGNEGVISDSNKGGTLWFWMDNNITFADCITIRGGILFLRIKDGLNISLLKSITFMDNNISYGRNFFIKWNSFRILKENIYNIIPSILNISSPRYEALGMSLDNTEISSIYFLTSLLNMNVSSLDDIYVCDGGIDNYWYRFEDFPCSTLSHLFRRSASNS